MTRQESKAWEEYKDLVLSAKNKFEAVKDEADKEFDQINGPA